MNKTKQKLRQYAIEIAKNKNVLPIHDADYWQDLAVFLIEVSRTLDEGIIINSKGD